MSNHTFESKGLEYHLTDGFKINKPHLAYTIIGGFTSIFMLVSLFIKEKLYIGEASEFADSGRAVWGLDG